MNLYDTGIKILQQRKFAFAERILPYYFASVGCHIFNLVNQEIQMFWEHGQIPNMRLHLMLVSPPGWLKSFTLKQLLRGKSSLFGDTQLNPVFTSTMTEAGFVGTIKFGEGGEPISVPGLCQEYSRSIIGIEEFSAIAQMMEVGYGRGLDVAYLTALDSGWVYKRLAAGAIEYHTDMTLWAGTQPMRFDMTAGMPRRLFFLQIVPTRQDKQIIKYARRQGIGITNSVTQTVGIKAMIEELFTKTKKLTAVHFEKELYKTLDQLQIPHYEESLYERLALGYTLVRKNFGEELFVQVDDTLKQLIMRSYQWRLQLKRGTKVAQVILTLRDYGGRMDMNFLRRTLLDLSLSWTESTEIVRQLVRDGTCKTDKKDIVLVGG